MVEAQIFGCGIVNLSIAFPQDTYPYREMQGIYASGNLFNKYLFRCISFDSCNIRIYFG